MGTLYKRRRRDGRWDWYLNLRINGRRVRRKVGPSKKQAWDALKDAERAAADRRYGLGKDDIAVGELCQRFLKHSNATHAPRTTERYSRAINRFEEFLSLNPRIVKACDVSQEVIEQFKAYRRQTRRIKGRNERGDEINYVRARSVNFDLSVLSIIFGWAKRLGYVWDNPVDGVKRLKENDSKPLRYLSADESEALLKHCDEPLKSIVYLFLNTGMRRSELENLETTDIDFQRRKIKIQSKPGWKPKTQEREIPMNEGIHELLRRVVKERKPKHRSDHYLFPRNGGSKFPVDLPKGLLEASRAAGIEDLTSPHVLRHTFASHLVMAGVDLPTVQKLLGHASIATTMRYSHLAADHLAGAVDRLPFR